MDWNGALQAISMVGFPIVAYGAMFWYMIKQNENHRTESDSIREALQENTIAIRELRAIIERSLNE